MREGLKGATRLAVLLLCFSESVLSQSGQPHKTLTIAGHSGEAPLAQVNGRSYIDLEALAQLTGGSLSFNGNRITLTLSSGTVSPPPPEAAPPQGFSKGFVAASIEDMALVREWLSALANAVQNGYPVTDTWISSYRDRATKGLNLVALAASTPSDHDVLQLINNGFNIMSSISDKYVDANRSHTYMATDSLTSDSQYQKLLACKDNLRAMWSSGQFQDNGACH